VIDTVHFLQERPQLGPVVDIAAREMYVRRKPPRIARRQVVQPADLVSLAGQVVGKRRAEKTSRAGN